MQSAQRPSEGIAPHADRRPETAGWRLDSSFPCLRPKAYSLQPAFTPPTARGLEPRRQRPIRMRPNCPSTTTAMASPTNSNRGNRPGGNGSSNTTASATNSRASSSTTANGTKTTGSLLKPMLGHSPSTKVSQLRSRMRSTSVLRRNGKPGSGISPPKPGKIPHSRSGRRNKAPGTVSIQSLPKTNPSSGEDYRESIRSLRNVGRFKLSGGLPGSFQGRVYCKTGHCGGRVRRELVLARNDRGSRTVASSPSGRFEKRSERNHRHNSNLHKIFPH